MIRRNLHICGSTVKVLIVCAIIALAGIPSCGGGGGGSSSIDDDGDATTSTMGAMWTTNASLGALMVNDEGEGLAAITTSDGAGNVTGVTGFIYTDASGNETVVFIDANNLPTETVIGDFTFRFLNWNTAAQTVDVAMIFAPTGYVEIFRGLELILPTTSTAASFSVNAAGKAVCFPNCETENQNLSDLFNIGGTVIAWGSCGIAASVSMGAALIPCAGFLVNSARLVAEEDSSINNNEAVSGIFAGFDVAGCATANPLDCASVALAVGNRLLGVIEEEQADYAPVFTAADGWMQDPNVGSGVAQLGTGLITCTGAYECTPGRSFPCFYGGVDGTKECNDDCTWNSCNDSCGDGVCFLESNELCPSDCPVVCGDGLCNSFDGEIDTCPADCNINSCCVSSGNCPSETPTSCPGSCCCCPYNQTCNSQSICSAG